MYMVAPGETLLMGLVTLILLFVVLMIDIAIPVLRKVGIIERQEHDADNSDLTITTELPITPP